MGYFEQKIVINILSKTYILYSEFFQITQKPKDLQQPDHNYNDNYYIENIFDLAIHRKVSVYQPENHTYNNQYQQNGKKRHNVFFKMIRQR